MAPTPGVSEKMPSTKLPFRQLTSAATNKQATVDRERRAEEVLGTEAEPALRTLTSIELLPPSKAEVGPRGGRTAGSASAGRAEHVDRSRGRAFSAKKAKLLPTMPSPKPRSTSSLKLSLAKYAMPTLGAATERPVGPIRKTRPSPRHRSLARMTEVAAGRRDLGAGEGGRRSSLFLRALRLVDVAALLLGASEGAWLFCCWGLEFCVVVTVPEDGVVGVISVPIS